MQLYGPVRKAPELTGASPNQGHAASSQQLATSQQLASCLATPFTGEHSSLVHLSSQDVWQLFSYAYPRLCSPGHYILQDSHHCGSVFLSMPQGRNVRVDARGNRRLSAAGGLIA